jgi:hypothetical protein
MGAVLRAALMQRQKKTEKDKKRQKRRECAKNKGHFVSPQEV